MNIDEIVIKALAAVERRPDRAPRGAEVLTILEGSTFCICDDRGDIAARRAGSSRTTRASSRGSSSASAARAPLPLSSGRVEHFRAAFYLRNGTANGLPRDSISIARERFVGTGMQERITLRNESPERLELDVALEAEADFADIISVKLHDFSLGDPELAQPLPPPAPTTHDEARPPGLDRGSARRPRHAARLLEAGSARRERDDVRARARAARALGAQRSTSAPWRDRRSSRPFEQLDEERDVRGRRRRRLDAARPARARRLGEPAPLVRPLDRRPRGAAHAHGRVPQAALRGRDAVVHDRLRARHGDHVAADAAARPGDRDRRARRAHRAAGARVEDPTIDAEPGKIVHEVREGRCAESWFPRYYGSIDSTPLYLVLLAETWRWTDDAVARPPAARARAPRARVDRPLRRPRRRRVRRVQPHGRLRAREPVVEGLGRLAALPGRLVRRGADRGGRGAGLRLRREARARRDRARGVARQDAGRAARARGRGAPSALRRGVLGRRARRLLRARARRAEAARSTRAAPTWGISCGAGSSRPSASAKVVDQLLSEELWSGWGIRTMASDAAAFNPISYHNGTVWPHDTSLAAWGLARHGYTAEARRIARALDRGGSALRLVAAGGVRRLRARRDALPDRLSDRRASAGVGCRARRSSSSACSSGSSPTASGSGSSRPSTDELPSWLDGLRIEGVRAFGRTWTVAVERGHVIDCRKKRLMRVGLVCPVWFPVPPEAYGGTERVVALLADGLVDAGHDVTLFASGDSQTRARLESVFHTAPSEWIGHTYWEMQHARPRVPQGRRVRHRPRPHRDARARVRRADRRRRSATRCTARSTGSRAGSTSRSSISHRTRSSSRSR